MAGRLEGKVALIVGAGQTPGATIGNGRATALRFAQEGATVFLVDRRLKSAEETLAMVIEGGGNGVAHEADVTSEAACAGMVDACMKLLGRIDILHNNAYWAPLYTSVPDTTIEQWDRTIAVTLTGVFLGCKYAIPHMIEAGGGVIVNTASTAAIVASPTFGAYSAAKSGVLGLTRSIAYDFGPKNIRCNAVLPGLIRTAATAPVLSNEERSEWLRSKIVVGRIGEPSDIAHAVLYLASEESSFMTGQTLVIDGGRQIG